MAYAPVELRHVRLRRGLLGYRRRSVDRLIDEVAESFEGVWRERADLADRLEQLETDLGRYKEHEQLLHTALLSAERAAAEVKEQAKREGEVVLEEARSEARSITRAARAECELLAAESRRIRALLVAALDAVDEADHRIDGRPDAAAEVEADTSIGAKAEAA